MIIFIVIHAHEENSILTQSRVNLVFFERKIFIRKLFRVQLRELRTNSACSVASTKTTSEPGFQGTFCASMQSIVERPA